MGQGISPRYYKRGPWLLSWENTRKIEPKEIPSCLIPAYLFYLPDNLKSWWQPWNWSLEKEPRVQRLLVWSIIVSTYFTAGTSPLPLSIILIITTFESYHMHPGPIFLVIIIFCCCWCHFCFYSLLLWYLFSLLNMVCSQVIIFFLSYDPTSQSNKISPLPFLA